MAKQPLDSETLAQLEADAFSDESLEKESKTNHHKRRESFKGYLHWLSMATITVLFSGIILGTIILFLHWLTPKNCWLNFLDKDQLDMIKTIFFSALATNALKDTYKKFA